MNDTTAAANFTHLNATVAELERVFALNKITPPADVDTDVEAPGFGPLSVACPLCMSTPGRKCTGVSSNGRVEVTWVHDAREELAPDPEKAKRDAQTAAQQAERVEALAAASADAPENVPAEEIAAHVATLTAEGLSTDEISTLAYDAAGGLPVVLTQKGIDFIMASDVKFEILRWGASDTVVRESIGDLFAKETTGRGWPTYGENLSDEERHAFGLKVAYEGYLKGLFIPTVRIADA